MGRHVTRDGAIRMAKETLAEPVSQDNVKLLRAIDLRFEVRKISSHV